LIDGGNGIFDFRFLIADLKQKTEDCFIPINGIGIRNGDLEKFACGG
jgi:hypothetical protein